MAEIQQATNSADLPQRFIELVMMNAQQAALCLGQMPHPSTGKAEVNLEAAKMFIDHLEIIREKSRGNLSKDEEKILSAVLSELQLAYVQLVRGSVSAASHEEAPNADASHHGDSGIATTPESTAPFVDTPKTEQPSSDDTEGKKKFTKSYGA